ncbi:hypothetical protein CS542_06665 [Pedobacter sp. IW39]|nr:hypothetical protein CS542_06665 [Pedobacter sp. IW39]
MLAPQQYHGNYSSVDLCHLKLSNISFSVNSKADDQSTSALTIISQVIMGTLSGALRLFLLYPLLAIIIILVDGVCEKWKRNIGDTAR